MARPEKNTVEYFPHFVVSSQNIEILEGDFGNDGYAFLFKTLELLGSKENHFYDCRKTTNWKFLLTKTKVNEDIAIKIIELLIEMEIVDEELWSHKIIFSEKFIRNIASVYERRKRKCMQKPDLCKFLGIKCKQKPRSSEVSEDKSTQSIVKDSIEKKSKVEESSNPKKIFGDSSFEFQISKNYLEVQASRKAQVAVLIKDKGKDEILQQWAEQVAKIKKEYKLNENQIQTIFNYTLSHDFWKNQILSVAKFRKKNKEGAPYLTVIFDEMKKQSEYSRIADFSN